MRRRDFITCIVVGMAAGFARTVHAAPPGLGKPAPGFNLTLLDGKAVSLQEFRGKAVVVNFWSSG